MSLSVSSTSFKTNCVASILHSAHWKVSPTLSTARHLWEAHPAVLPEGPRSSAALNAAWQARHGSLPTGLSSAAGHQEAGARHPCQEACPPGPSCRTRRLCRHTAPTCHRQALWWRRLPTQYWAGLQSIRGGGSCTHTPGTHSNARKTSCTVGSQCEAGCWATWVLLYDAFPHSCLPSLDFK